MAVNYTEKYLHKDSQIKYDLFIHETTFKNYFQNGVLNFVEQEINHIINVFSPYDQGIIRHIVAYYFWGFEDLKNEGLLLQLINNADPSAKVELINFVWRQEDYLKGLSISDSAKFEKIIFNLWNYLATKYENTQDEEEQKILSDLIYLLVFVPQLNEKYTKLILKSSPLSDKNFHSHYLIENLIKLKGKGNQIKNANFIGLILNSIPFSSYFTSIDNEHITELIVFLYENKQKINADILCNKLTKQGHEFLIPIHNKYKE